MQDKHGNRITGGSRVAVENQTIRGTVIGADHRGVLVRPDGIGSRDFDRWVRVPAQLVTSLDTPVTPGIVSDPDAAFPAPPVDASG